MYVSVYYFVQYLNSQARWVASSKFYTKDKTEAFQLAAQQVKLYKGTTVRVIKSTKVDGLINQEVITN